VRRGLRDALAELAQDARLNGVGLRRLSHRPRKRPHLPGIDDDDR
jgi:hypothetical protein